MRPRMELFEIDGTVRKQAKEIDKLYMAYVHAMYTNSPSKGAMQDKLLSEIAKLHPTGYSGLDTKLHEYAQSAMFDTFDIMLGK